MPGDFDTAVLSKTSHRPWPVPRRPWVMTQTWHDLLFAHWAIEPTRLVKRLPWPFELDLFEGRAWVGVVPFRMTNVAPRGVPSLPKLSSFPELNVRTYVRVGGRPGVYFFSLDAGSRVAVAAARMLLNLPYHPAQMSVATDGDDVAYRSVRESAIFSARYRPAGRPFSPRPGTLDHFLTERYCLYHHHRSGTPYRLDIHHKAWSLQAATADFSANGMGAVNGFALEGPPRLLFARRQDMVAWMPVTVGTAGSRKTSR